MLSRPMNAPFETVLVPSPLSKITAGSHIRSSSGSPRANKPQFHVWEVDIANDIFPPNTF